MKNYVRRVPRDTYSMFIHCPAFCPKMLFWEVGSYEDEKGRHNRVLWKNPHYVAQSGHAFPQVTTVFLGCCPCLLRSQLQILDVFLANLNGSLLI